MSRQDSPLNNPTFPEREAEFSFAIQGIESAGRNRAGAILPIVPDRARWNDFLASVRREWDAWKNELQKYPASLIVLYSGIAFFNYKDNTFWPHFAEAVTGRPDSDSPPPNQQTQFNHAFQRALKYYQLKAVSHDNRNDFVGSAVWHIGIPLSLWDGFIDICEWASWRHDWKSMTSDEWVVAIAKRAANRPRLQQFLIDNREAATGFIQDILDVRDILKRYPDSTIMDIAPASILRFEYFEEVPETAEFIRPKNPDSLFQDRARLVWSEERRRICVQLPGVNREHLPATWRIGGRQQPAASTPTELILNSEAFQPQLSLVRESKESHETQHLLGAHPWGLFDLEGGGRLINSNRHEVPLKSYALISPQKIAIASIEGFDQTESPNNEVLELSDGSECFVTRLWPTGKFAEVVLRHQDVERRLRFRARAKIELRHFFGKMHKAAYFNRMPDGTTKCEDYPTFCVAIPKDYFRDSYTELRNSFKVKEADSIASGQWQRIHTEATDDKEYFEWRWAEKPFIEKKKTGVTMRTLKELGRAFKPKDAKGNKTLCIESPHFHESYTVEKVGPNTLIDESWRNLPGKYALWFILCQAEEGMKWDDLMLARDVIAPGSSLAYSLLRKCASLGLLIQRGHRWCMGKPQAEVGETSRGAFELKYCGDPSILWGLYRTLSYDAELPEVEIVDKRGEVPCLRMIWALGDRTKVTNYLEKRGVDMGGKLWTR